MTVIWLAAVILVFAAAMLVADVGATALWISIIAVGVAFVAVAANRNRSVHR